MDKNGVVFWLSYYEFIDCFEGFGENILIIEEKRNGGMVVYVYIDYENEIVYRSGNY